MDQYLDARGLSKKLNVAVGTIYSWVARGLIPYEKFNGLTRFKEKSIVAWHEEKERDRKRKNFEI